MVVKVMVDVRDVKEVSELIEKANELVELVETSWFMDGDLDIEFTQEFKEFDRALSKLDREESVE